MNENTRQKILDKENADLDELAENLRARYGDYVLIVKPHNKGRMWRTSNLTWAFGACMRLVDWIKIQDSFYDMAELRENLGGGSAGE